MCFLTLALRPYLTLSLGAVRFIAFSWFYWLASFILIFSISSESSRDREYPAGVALAGSNLVPSARWSSSWKILCWTSASGAVSEKWSCQTSVANMDFLFVYLFFFECFRGFPVLSFAPVLYNTSNPGGFFTGCSTTVWCAFDRPPPFPRPFGSISTPFGLANAGFENEAGWASLEIKFWSSCLMKSLALSSWSVGS